MAPMMKTSAELELHYHDIMELFAIADQLVEYTETSENPDQYVREIEALASTVAETADVLSEEFFVITNGKVDSKKLSSKKIESSLRRAYMAMADFVQSASISTRKHAEKLLTKLKRQLEVVIANVVEFVVISLDRVMQKTEIEELKRRQERIAVMLHQLSQKPLA